MIQQFKSLRSKQRSEVISAYRGRGKRNNNLWLVYSVKTDRDWILPSDRQLVHWIYYLETNPLVASFDLMPIPIISHDGEETRGTELDAIVMNTDGSTEWHEVKSSESEKTRARSQLNAQSSAAVAAAATYRIFTDTDLRPLGRISIRWLKAICSAAAIRGQEQVQATLSILSIIQSQQAGYVVDLVDELAGFDSAILLGVLARLTIQGHVNLDLQTKGYGYSTRWAAVRA